MADGYRLLDVATGESAMLFIIAKGERAYIHVETRDGGNCAFQFIEDDELAAEIHEAARRLERELPNG